MIVLQSEMKTWKPWKACTITSGRIHPDLLEFFGDTVRLSMLATWRIMAQTLPWTYFRIHPCEVLYSINGGLVL